MQRAAERFHPKRDRTNIVSGEAEISSDITGLLYFLRWVGHRHWILRGRDRFIRIFCTPETSKPVQFEVPFFGLKYRGRLNSFIDWTVFFYGAWASNELLLLRDTITALRLSGMTTINAYDVGANVGNHTLFLATLCERVIAFEPYPPVRNQMLDNLALNRIDNVTVYPVGLADEDAELSYFEPGAASQGEGTFVSARDAKQTSLTLPVKRGDDFLAGENLPPINILKLDVEGFDAHVLAGLQSRLAADRPVVLMELSPGTRSDVVDFAGLRRLFPPGYLFVEVGTRSISGPYVISSFNFASTREFLAFPDELKEAMDQQIPRLKECCGRG